MRLEKSSMITNLLASPKLACARVWWALYSLQHHMVDPPCLGVSSLWFIRWAAAVFCTPPCGIATPINLACTIPPVSPLPPYCSRLGSLCSCYIFSFYYDYSFRYALVKLQHPRVCMPLFHTKKQVFLSCDHFLVACHLHGSPYVFSTLVCGSLWKFTVL